MASNVVTIPDEATIETFEAGLRGQLLRPGREGYDTARTVWNAMIDKRPALIARCAGTADVIRSVGLARDHGLIVSVRGGGHNVAGNAVCNDGLMIDLSPMKGIWVDPERRTARAEAGCTWRDLDHECQAFGLATTGGVIPTTGIAGLTLGGGIGWLMGKHGLSCDNLCSVDLVTADSRLVTANAEENPDLFWGLRGGGGNFGVATSFEYRIHPVDQVLGGMVVHPFNKAREALRFYRDFVLAAPDELGSMAALLNLAGGREDPGGGRLLLRVTGQRGADPPAASGVRPAACRSDQPNDLHPTPGHARSRLPAGNAELLEVQFPASTRR